MNDRVYQLIDWPWEDEWAAHPNQTLQAAARQNIAAERALSELEGLHQSGQVDDDYYNQTYNEIMRSKTIARQTVAQRYIDEGRTTRENLETEVTVDHRGRRLSEPKLRIDVVIDSMMEAIRAQEQRDAQGSGTGDGSGTGAGTGTGTGTGDGTGTGGGTGAGGGSGSGTGDGTGAGAVVGA